MPRRIIKDAKGLGEWLIKYWIAERTWEKDNPGKNPRTDGGPQPAVSGIDNSLVEFQSGDQLLFALDRDNLLHIVVPVCPKEWTLEDLQKFLSDDSTPIDTTQDNKTTAGEYKKKLGFVIMGGCR